MCQSAVLQHLLLLYMFCVLAEVSHPGGENVLVLDLLYHLFTGWSSESLRSCCCHLQADPQTRLQVRMSALTVQAGCLITHVLLTAQFSNHISKLS